MSDPFHVRFTFEPYERLAHPERAKKFDELFRASFGVPVPTRRTVVLCTAAQFAKFLILRNQMKLANAFKELEPEIIPPAPPVEMLDVTDTGSEWREAA